MGSVNQEISQDIMSKSSKLIEKQLERIINFLQKMMLSAEEYREKETARRLLQYQKDGGDFQIYKIPNNIYPIISQSLEDKGIPIMSYKDVNTNTKLSLIRGCDKEEVDKIIYSLKTKGVIDFNGDSDVLLKKDVLFSKGDHAIKIKNLTKNEVNALLENTNNYGYGFPVAAEKQKDGRYSVLVREDNIFNSDLKSKKMDMVTALTKTMVTLYGNGALIKDHQIEYDQQLQQICVDYCYNAQENEKKFLVSATDKTKYLELTNKGFTVYSRNKNSNFDIERKEVISENKNNFKNSLEKEYFRMNNCMIVEKDELDAYLNNEKELISPREKYDDKAKNTKEIEKKVSNYLIYQKKIDRLNQLAEQKMSLSDCPQVENISAFFNSEVTVEEFLQHEYVNEGHIKEENEIVDNDVLLDNNLTKAESEFYKRDKVIATDVINILKDKAKDIEFEEIELTAKELSDTKNSFELFSEDFDESDYYEENYNSNNSFNLNNHLQKEKNIKDNDLFNDFLNIKNEDEIPLEF